MIDDQKDMDLIERIRSLGRYAPRATFRIKVAIASALPSYGMALAGRSNPRPGWGPRYGWTRPVKLVAASAMALLVAVVIFSGLVAASSGSLPGQALYGLKRFREGLDLALASSPTRKAQRYLTLASARLSELDTMSQKGIIDSETARSIARDYASETAGAAQVIEQQPTAPETLVLARQLQALQTQKDNMVRRLAAASPAGVLAEAGGAKVALQGASGQVSGTADEGGSISFTADVTPATTAGLAAMVEDDGRQAIVPIYQPAEGSRYHVTVQPGNRVLEVNQPEMFTLQVARANGTAVASSQVRLSDPTMTSTLDGKAGSVALRTDATGLCSVTVTKTSIDQVSRIMMQVADPGWVDVGEVVRLGGVKSPVTAAVPGDVRVATYGAGADMQRVEMDNGLVKVVAAQGDDGEIMTSMTRVSSAFQCGPLFDPLPAQAGLIGKNVTTSGPRVFFSSGKAAGYETVLEMPTGDGSIRKDYKVFLSSGDSFATVQCSVELAGTAAGLVSANPGLAGTCALNVPAAATVAVGGRDIAKPQTVSSSVRLSLQIGSPYFTLTQGQNISIGAFPIGSATYPTSLTLTAGSICPTPPSLPADGVTSQTMVLGLTDKGSLENIVSRARMAIGDPSQGTSAAADQGSRGFSIVAEPTLDKLGTGKQKITLKVFKQYEKVLSVFQSN